MKDEGYDVLGLVVTFLCWLVGGALVLTLLGLVGVVLSR